MTDILPSAELIIASETSSPQELFNKNDFTTKKVSPADTELWLKMGQLRAEVYLKNDYITLDDVDKDGAEYDQYDERADHFVAVNDEGDVIGTVRVIRRGDDLSPLPSEEEFGVTLPDDASEISRFMHALDTEPNEGLLISLALMRATLKATTGVSNTIYAVLEKKLHRQLEFHVGVGLKKVVNEPLVIPKYRSTENYLVEMEPRFITSQIHARDERMAKRVIDHPTLADSILGKSYAPFFERANAAQGLGRISMADFDKANPEQFTRNDGFFSSAEQERIFDSTVAIAGAGGDGGQLAIALARLGVTKFKLADPEIFGVENLNRQAGSSYATIGQNKAEVIAKILRGLGASVAVYTEGITEENIHEFVTGSNLIIDETELTMPELGTMIAREARAQNLPVLMALNVGFGSYVTSFDPKGVTFESYLGINPDPELPLAEVDIAKWVPQIPTYANTGVLTGVMKGEISLPTVGPGVLFAAADASTQAIAHLLSDMNPEWNKRIEWAPHGRSVDAIDGTKIVKNRAVNFALSSLRALIRTKLHKNDV